MASEEFQTVHMSDGCAITVKILGDGPNKPLLIAHHGAPGLSTHKEPEIQFGWLTETFKIFCFDMRGSGASDKKRPYTHERWVQDVEELRQWAGAEKFVMIGASHGGFLTIEYTIAHPDRLYGAIAGDSGAQWAHWGALSAMKTAMTDPRVKPDPEQVLRMLSGRTESLEDLTAGVGSIFPLYGVPEHLKGEAEVDVNTALDGALVPFHETINAAQGDCLSRFDVRDRLAEIKIPVFVYTGRYDWICPVQLNEELAAGIKGCKLVIYEKSGHMPALEEKTKFQNDVRDFLGTLSIPEVKS